jgi:hypothetical protein
MLGDKLGAISQEGTRNENAKLANKQWHQHQDSHSARHVIAASCRVSRINKLTALINCRKC